MSGENEINNKKRDFDQEAANWDQVPGRVKVALDIAQSMIREITLTPDMDICLTTFCPFHNRCG